MATFPTANGTGCDSSQTTRNYSDEYVDLLERRLKDVEDELRLLRGSDRPPTTPSVDPEETVDGATGGVKNSEQADDHPDNITAADDAKADHGTSYLDPMDYPYPGSALIDVPDQDQVIKLEQLSYQQFRKAKPRAGVNKGSAMMFVTAIKGRNGGNASAIVPENEILDVPYRLAINSNGVLDILSEITNTAMKSRNVHVRPFKFLLANEELIKDKLVALDEECQLAEERASESVDAAADTTTRERVENLHAAPGDVEHCKKICKRGHLKLLVEFMNTRMQDIFELRTNLDTAKIDEVYFEDLWHLFRPGQVVFQNTNESDNAIRAYRVLHVTGGRAIVDLDGKANWKTHDYQPVDVLPEAEYKHKVARHTNQYSKMTPFVLDLLYIDFDGEVYGPKSIRIPILEYSGKEKIRSLEVYPARYGNKAIETTLLDRGKRFLEYSKVHHRHYEGRSLNDKFLHEWLASQWKSDTKSRGDEEVSCECVVDQAHVLGPDFSFKGGFISKSTPQDPREFTDAVSCSLANCTLCQGTDQYLDSEIDQRYRDEFLDSDAGRHLLEIRRHKDFADDCTGAFDDVLILLPLRLYGYALADRKWHALCVNSFTERVADRSFDDLVLPENNKRLLQALVKNHIGFSIDPDVKPDPGDRTQFKERTSVPQSLDIIRGKGRGLIILLHGVPGVGKTSTAESIASQLDRPLFPITCGDLGTTASAVESALMDFFTLAAKWKCVLLLDEADVFLAQRKGGDFKRNGLVSVFLRVLEWYAGILILTTNRVGEFDEAFRSRIHISLYYPRLTRTSTEDIWKLNLRRIAENPGFNMDIEKEKILEFSRLHWVQNQDFPSRLWNGRQIKNGFQTAVALANWDFWHEGGHKTRAKPLLTAKQFEYVAKTSEAFDDYLDEVHHSELGAYTDWVAYNKLRKDDHDPSEPRAPRRASGTPTRRSAAKGPHPSTPRGHAPRTTTANSADTEEDGEKEARIKWLKTKLKNVNKMKVSEEKREEIKFDIQSELEQLGVPDAFDDRDNDAPESQGQESKSRAPWG